ncbi:MAG: hypothetical protein AB1563_07730 [Bacillota bacterium]
MSYRRSEIKGLLFTALVVSAVIFGLAVWGWANHSPGGGTFFSLLKATNARIGDLSFSPDTQKNPGTDEISGQYMYVGARGTNATLTTFALADSQLQGGFGAISKSPSTHPSVGAFLYGEAATGSATTVWGANPHAVTFSPSSNAVGEEVNGVNRTSPPSTAPIVYGMNIVNGGTAATDAGLIIQTSNSEPAGRPDYGIILGGPSTGTGSSAPATITGLLIDRVSSGEAIRIMENNRIALNKNGSVYIRYNTSTDRIELVRGGVVVASF